MKWQAHLDRNSEDNVDMCVKNGLSRNLFHVADDIHSLSLGSSFYFLATLETRANS